MKKVPENRKFDDLHRRAIRHFERGWMKMTLLLLSAVIVAVVFLTGGVILLADAHPFGPGHPLFLLQFAAESIRLELIFDDVDQADEALLLAERRPKAGRSRYPPTASSSS